MSAVEVVGLSLGLAMLGLGCGRLGYAIGFAAGFVAAEVARRRAEEFEEYLGLPASHWTGSGKGRDDDVLDAEMRTRP